MVGGDCILKGFIAPAVCLLIFAGIAAAGAQARTFYVSQSGSDAADGMSPESAWKTIAKVNGTIFQPGDRILLEAGRTYAGGFVLRPGFAADHVTLSTYGAGQATIRSDDLPCVSAINLADVHINNLNCVGSGAIANSAFGIVVQNSLEGDIKLDGPTITRNSVRGYGDNGIMVSGARGASGFVNITISSNTVHDVTGREANVHMDSACIRVSVDGAYPDPSGHHNVHVSDNTVYNCVGQPNAADNTGSGILLSEVTDAVITHNIVHDTGSRNRRCGGPNGIWVYSSAHVLIEYNESYRNGTDVRAGGCDGNGFDLDGGVTDSIVQYNYSHDNHGADFLVYAFHDAAQPQWKNNVFRYNIGENSARGLDIANDHDQPMTGCYIYNNSFYGPVSIVTEKADAGIDCVIANNVFYVDRPIFSSSPAFEVPHPSHIVMVGNNYTGRGLWRWDGGTYKTLPEWRAATGQELLKGADTGSSMDPKLLDAGRGGTVGGHIPEKLRAYHLQTTSPMLGAGIDLHALYGIDVGPHDYFGAPVPDASGRYDVGAGGAYPHESASAAEGTDLH